MAKKILADGTVAVVNTKCICNLSIDTGHCIIVRTQGIVKNSHGVLGDLSYNNDTHTVLCYFPETGNTWYVGTDELRRATAKEKKQWPRN